MKHKRKKRTQCLKQLEEKLINNELCLYEKALELDKKRKVYRLNVETLADELGDSEIREKQKKIAESKEKEKQVEKAVVAEELENMQEGVSG